MVAHNFNTLVIQVYGDSYALYNSSFVPHSYLVAPDFDTLAEAVTRGHAAGLEVHAWMNVMNAYSGGLGWPSDPNHIINTHPEWAMVDDTGWSMINNVGESGTVIYYCPEIDGYEQYVHDVAVEIATNYDVDGVHMDYIRYPGSAYCYCDTHKADFYSTYGRYPSAGDPDWDQWRYDDVTDLVEWIYNDVRAVKPLCQVTAATWNTSGSYFQDAYGMLEGGILDAAFPMTYTSDMSLFTQWITAYNENSGGRNIYAGIYVPSNKIDEQIAESRAIGIEGQCIFSFADLGRKHTRDIDSEYTAPASPFPMPWLDGSPDLWPPVLSSIGSTGITGDSAIIKWHSDEKADSEVEYGLDTNYGSSVYDATLVFDHEMQLTDLSPSTTYHYRVISADGAQNSTASGDYTFTTTSGGIADIIIDDGDPDYAHVGTWYYTSGAGDAAYNGDYEWAPDDVVESASATWTPYITTAGDYDVYIMYREGTNRCDDVPFTVYYNGGSQTFYINQKTNGGIWNLLGNFNFAAGTGGYVKISNQASGGDVVVADAVKWSWGEATPTPTPTPTPSPTPEPSTVLHVEDIAMGSGNAGPNYWATATVLICDEDLVAIEGVTVDGDWTGATVESQSDITEGDGKVTFKSSKVRGGGTFVFTVTDVAKTGYTYNPAQNKETSDSITVP
jgi:uncharacterized lipoprotein YddW (UPF0748 family)